MTLDEAIQRAEEIAATFWSRGVDEENCRDCGPEHEQLAEWLKELKVRRGETPGKVISAEGFMEKVQHEAKAMHDEDSCKLLMWAEWIMDKTPDMFSGELDPDLPCAWIRTAERLPDKPNGPAWYTFEGEDIAADEYIVMIDGATRPTSSYWTGDCWYDPYDPTETTHPVIAWRHFPDPPSWTLKDPEHEEGDLPFPEVQP